MLTRGWYGYLKHAQGRVFQILDALIRRRLRALLRKQEKRPVRNVRTLGGVMPTTVAGPMHSSLPKGFSP